MAEAKKFKKTKGALKGLKTMHTRHAADQTVQWYMNNGMANTSTTYNNWSKKLFDEMDIHFCLLDAGGNCKQYSQDYKGLTKFNPSWVGFYPSTYTVQEVIDEAGTTQDKTITDMEELKNFPTMRKGATFYFAGVKYKVSNVDKTRGQGNYIGFAEDKNDAQEMIVIRASKGGWAIFNIGMVGNKKRQNYGSGVAINECIRDYGKSVLFSEETATGTPFMEQDEAYDDW
jgi:hypothetical protein